MKPWIDAHRFSIITKGDLQNDTLCGCFCCLSVFSPDEITEWIPDKTETAVCPYCGIDPIIGESSGYPITHKFLAKMKQYCF